MKKISIICLLLFILSILSACLLLPVEEAVLAPPQVAGFEPRALRTFETVRGDVMRFSNPAAIHIPARTEELRFNVSGQRLRGIFVSIGDTVSYGDIIAELVMPDAVHELYVIQREFDWAALELRHMEERNALARGENEWFASEVQRLTDRLTILEMRLEYVRANANNRYIFAPFDGIIVAAHQLLVPTWSHSGFVAAIIADHAGFVFRVSGSDTAYMQLGQQFDMLVNGEPFVGIVIEPPPDIDIPGQNVFLTLVGETPTLGAQNFASVHVVKEMAEDVVMVPNLAVNRVLDRVFVYIIENGVRVLRYIETGLVGNHMTEVVLGLVEGEIVINE